ncbi:putative alpha-L-fucosidase [Chrysoperla carnea]|uniref:putative alpha-L-fucosidase n=1 Tax=Chrysoperla carnea TaxID=189513 RepID=UPI001D076E34|nr:putative alpha-L-fucosidase [Chrysoperla carnea]
MIIKIIFIYLLIPKSLVFNKRYEPDWDSLDTRPIPKWYDQAKIGIFIHWGVFSVPSFGNEWFWYFWKNENASSYIEFMSRNYPPDFTYQNFAADFTGEFFNPKEWVKLFVDSGAKYVVLTSKHHEGYTLWPSSHTFGWNSRDIGPGKDLVGELATAVRAESNIKFGLYYSMKEWYHPLYLEDKSNDFQTNYFVYNKTLPELREITEKYLPDVIWSDGVIEATEEYWKGPDFLAWLYNDSPVKDTVVVNDRWSISARCKHGDFITCVDNYKPGELQKKKWESAITTDKTLAFGYRRESLATDYRSIKEILQILIETISLGGNLLINVGPTKEGTIIPILQERLQNIGKWLNINGEAIYNSSIWIKQNDTINGDVWYTTRTDLDDKPVYAMFCEWPDDIENKLLISYTDELFTKHTRITLLGYENVTLKWKNKNGTAVEIILPANALRSLEWCWVLKLTLTVTQNEI